jgi:hypothetical protein
MSGDSRDKFDPSKILNLTLKTSLFSYLLNRLRSINPVVLSAKKKITGSKLILVRKDASVMLLITHKVVMLVFPYHENKRE